MTIQELRDYLAKYTGEGNGDLDVVTCDHRDNPIMANDVNETKDVLFIESMNGDSYIVRCKDCKYYDEKDEDCNHPGLWAEYASDFGLGMYPDDFCYYGERINDENND